MTAAIIKGNYDQCAFSIAYLKEFKRGPFETVLRAWTNWSWNGQIKKKGQITHE